MIVFYSGWQSGNQYETNPVAVFNVSVYAYSDTLMQSIIVGVAVTAALFAILTLPMTAPAVAGVMSGIGMAIAPAL